ncbi:MAG: sigma-70 family RNA polymerase sigma factor [Verrucomicrobiota bacterium]
MNDRELLRAWVEQRSEIAFTELVNRHASLVYGSALRQMRDPDLAQDVCQAVFVTLANKAAQIRDEAVLSGWLFRTTHFVAARALRARSRRHYREVAASTMTPIQTPTTPDSWPELAAQLDGALAGLRAIDRDAIVWHYLERQPLRAVGERFGISEDAAKKRVSRAVDKLRQILLKRGVGLSAAMLAACLSQVPAEAMPAPAVATMARAAMTQAVPADITELVRLATRDAFRARGLEASPLALSALVLMAAAAFWWHQTTLKKERAEPTAEVNPIQLGAGQAAPAVRRSVNSAPQRGSTQIRLAIRAAEDDQPVRAELNVNGSSFRGQAWSQALATDTNGLAEFSVQGDVVDHLRVWISAHGYVPITVGWRGHEFVEPVLHYTARLQRGHRLQGHVQNQGSEPVAGAHIVFNSPGAHLEEREDIGFHRRLTEVVSDEQGDFQSDQLPLPMGDQQMSYVVDHPDYVRRLVPLEEATSLATNHLITLTTGYRLRGQVTDLDGNPIAGAKVEHDRTAATESDGSFELGPVAGGEIRLSANAAGYQEASARLLVNQATTNIWMKLAVASSDPSSWDRAMAAGRTVRVTGSVVDDASGEPVSDFQVRLNEDRGCSEFLGQGQTGRFDWPVFMAFFDSFSLQIDATGYAPSVTEMRSVRSATQNFKIRLKRSLEITGRVVNAAGQSVPDAYVGLIGDSIAFTCWLGRNGSPESGANTAQTTTDAQGRFHFRPRFGTRSVLAAHELGCAVASLEQLAKGPLVLRPYGSIEGTLLMQGRPVAGQQMFLTSESPSGPRDPYRVRVQENTKTDDQGHFRFGKVAPGEVVLSRLFDQNRNHPGPIGMSHPRHVIVPESGVAQVIFEEEGTLLTGKLVLSKPLKGHDWRDDLPALVPIASNDPEIIAPAGTLEWRRQWHALNVALASRPKFFLEMQPDGSFRVADVPPGQYDLHLTVHEPFDSEAHDELGNLIERRPLGHFSSPIAVTAGDSSKVQSLGTIVVAWDEMPRP